MERLKNPKLIAALVLAAVAAVVFVQNREPPVHMRFFFVRTEEMPFAVALLLTFLLGLVTGVLASSRWKTQREKAKTTNTPTAA